jgi:hypothetical protein
VTSRADDDPRGFEIGARRLAAHADGLFDAAERPAEPPQSQNLLSLVLGVRGHSVFIVKAPHTSAILKVAIHELV